MIAAILNFLKCKFKILVWPYTRNRSLTELVAVICITRSMWRIKAKNSNMVLIKGVFWKVWILILLVCGLDRLQQIKSSNNLKSTMILLYNQTSDDDLYNS